MFTFHKHVSHLVWQLHVTCCVIIVDVIQNSFWLVSRLVSNFSGNGVLHLLHFEYIKTFQYPSVELTGAASVTHSSTWELINYWHMHCHLSSYLDTVETKTWIKHNR